MLRLIFWQRRVSNQSTVASLIKLVLGFPTGRDKGTEVSSLSQDKGTTGQDKNLTKGRDGPRQPKFETGQTETAKIRDGTRDKTGQSRKGRENDVLKQKTMFYNRKTMFYNRKTMF